MPLLSFLFCLSFGTMKKFSALLFIVLHIFATICGAQSSFLRELIDAPLPFLTEVEAKATGGVFVAQKNFSLDLGDIMFAGFSADGMVEEAFLLDVSVQGTEDCVGLLMGYDHNDNAGDLFSVFFLDAPFTGCTSAIYFIDTEQNIVWGRKLSKSIGQTKFLASFISDSSLIVHHAWGLDVLTSQNGYIDSMGLALFDLSGNEIWNHFYQCSSFASGSVYRTAENAAIFPGGNVSVLGINSNSFFLLRLDEHGNVLSSKGVLNAPQWEAIDQVVDKFGNIYLVGRLYNEEEDKYDGFLLKINESYEVLWCKLFYADQYDCYDFKLALGPTNTLAFAYISVGEFPVIFGEVTLDGQLLWKNGFSAYDPSVAIGEDGAFYFTSSKKYFPDASYIYRLLLAKTDANGHINDCPEFNACLELYDISPPVFEELEWIRSDGYSLPAMPVTLMPANVFSSPYCGSPTPPHPYFVLPDTICAGDCLSPDSTYNRLAHQVEWYITGPGGLDTTIIDTTFTWCFDQPGHYQVEQGIWLLGCSDYFLRDVEVLPDDLAPALGEDRILCEQPPYSLSANASRPLTSYLWSDGSTAAELQITASGTYWLEASDGYCILRDTVQLTFLDDLLGQGPALSLPADTAVCEQHLPYELLPQSPYAEGFSVPAISNSSASSFELWQAGSYEVQAELFGCPIRDTFALEVNDCRSRIYFPTAFSPNGDGLNDLFLPQGKDYQGIELQIYDRWGGLLFSSQSPPFAWDGSDAAGGVYVYRFRYFNTLALQEEEVSGQVVLLR